MNAAPFKAGNERCASRPPRCFIFVQRCRCCCVESFWKQHMIKAYVNITSENIGAVRLKAGNERCTSRPVPPSRRDGRHGLPVRGETRGHPRSNSIDNSNYAMSCHAMNSTGIGVCMCKCMYMYMYRFSSLLLPFPPFPALPSPLPSSPFPSCLLCSSLTSSPLLRHHLSAAAAAAAAAAAVENINTSCCCLTKTTDNYCVCFK